VQTPCLTTKNCLNNRLAQDAIWKKGENITKNEGYLIGIQWKENFFYVLDIGSKSFPTDLN
jgi:hypothetical protein